MVIVDTCSWVKKMSLTDGDYTAISTTLLAQILVHNEEYLKNCNKENT